MIRHYLPYNSFYVTVEPSLEWLRREWSALDQRFPCQTILQFVRGLGECLPFATGRFDSVLSFWSLNHASRPQQVFREVGRVLRPGGRFLMVLEDMPPCWGDIVSAKFIKNNISLTTRMLIRKLYYIFGDDEWPLQSDHIRIREVDLLRWASNNFDMLRRYWMNQYLTFEFQKK